MEKKLENEHGDWDFVGFCDATRPPANMEPHTALPQTTGVFAGSF